MTSNSLPAGYKAALIRNIWPNQVNLLRERFNAARNQHDFIAGVLQDMLTIRMQEQTLLEAVEAIRAYLVQLQQRTTGGGATDGKKKKKGIGGKPSSGGRVNNAGGAGVSGGSNPDNTALGGNGTSALTQMQLQQQRGRDMEFYFTGHGEDAQVPPYLRYKGYLRNRHLTREQVRLLITDIWQQKIHFHLTSATSSAGVKHARLCDFYFNTMKRMFSTVDAVMEWSYNIIEACRAYQDVAECRIFLFLLTRSSNAAASAANHRERM
jgi:hypothetical protein